MIDDSRQIKDFINKKYVNLSVAIFNQAIDDVRINSIPRPIKNEAWRWLLNDGYLFFVDLLGFDVSAEEYLKLLNSFGCGTSRKRKFNSKTNRQGSRGGKNAIQA